MKTKSKSRRQTEPRKANVYLDESGNTGPNLIDWEQPVYVVAGWVVPRPSVVRVEQTVSKLIADFGVQSKELHGKKLLRTARGQGLFRQLCRTLGGAGSWPVFSIAEKRYWIAGKVVETLLDSHYNKAVPEEFYNNIMMKQEVANDISEFNDEYLREFAEAYRSLDEGALARSAGRLATLFELKGQSELAAWTRASINVMDTIVGLERQSCSDDVGQSLRSVNVPVFVSFTSHLECMARDVGIDELAIFHDQSNEFQVGYKWVVQLQTEGPRLGELRLPNDRSVFFGMERVKSLTMLKSEASPLIQVADVLASGIGRYARCVARGQEPPSFLREGLDLTLSSILLNAFDDKKMPRLGEVLGTPSFLGGM